MKGKNMSLYMVSKALLIVGGLNWGLIGVLDFNLVEVLFGNWPWLVTLVYVLVGLSALVVLSKGCKHCKK